MVKFLSINARGLADENKRRAVFDYHRKNADILMIYETHSTPNIEHIWENEWGGKIIFCHGNSNSKGVAVLTSRSIYNNIDRIYKDSIGRTIIFDYTENEQKVTVVALYAPNEDCPKYFIDIVLILRERQENKIVIGDFNLALDLELDRKNTYYNNNKAKEEVLNMMDEFQLRDLWRIRNPDKNEYSWIKKIEKGRDRKASRIDLALVSGGIDQRVELIMYLSSIKTDHRAIYIVLELVSNDRGTGFWKFNCSLLQNKEFVDFMNQELDTTLDILNKTTVNNKDKWEKLKTRVKKASCGFTRKQAAQTKLILSQLSERVNEYEANLPLNWENDVKYENTKQELEEKQLERTVGIMFRSKAKWYELGEKNTKYFYSLEKAKYNAKTCFALVSEQQEDITDQHKILELQKEFYTELYAKDEDVSFSMQNNFGVRVPQEIYENQCQQITISELETAIKQMKNSKTPGQDGLPIEFYKVFWSKVKSVFYGMVIEAWESEMLHRSARQGVLNLIPKPNKDTRYIKNLRPITLLNVDYKIIEKAIANKMIPALEYIIHQDQRGFMKERRISVNIRKMLDIIHQAKKDDLEAIVMSMDFVKCFDKCSFSILHGSLDFFNFGSVVKKWTKILYTDFSVKIQNNGNFSQEIAIRKGVHQGGCCSSIYFLVIAEILALSLRSNVNIQGITIRDIRNLLNQFADDMDIFSICDQKSIEAIHHELDSFRLQSGFTVSYDKTTIYRIGSLRHSNAAMYEVDQFMWSCRDINVLGVQIAHQDIVEKNYGTIVEKVNHVLNTWYNRGLSLIGKIQVVNTMVASLFVYKMMVLPFIPEVMLKKIDNKIREFIWSKKKPKIKYKILQAPKIAGGLGLVDLHKKEIALKATWPKILYKEQEYAKMVYNILRIPIEEDIWRCRIEPQEVKNLKLRNEFWEDVLHSWNQYNFFVSSRIENQILWYNSYIKVSGKMIMWKDVYQRGLKFVYQLYDDCQFKSDQQVWEEFGLTKLRFNSLKLVLPQSWKDHFTSHQRSEYFPLPPHAYDWALLDKNLSSKVYKYIGDDATIVVDKYNKWEIDLGESIAEDIYAYGRLHQKVFTTTNVAKYRSFQYRMLQRALITNVQLEKWGIKPSSLCTFCKKEDESIVHLFFQCEYVQTLWSRVFEWIEDRYQVTFSYLNFTPSSIIKNELVQGASSVINFICLLTKYYIYTSKCLQNELEFIVLKRLILKIESIEKYIAIKNGKLELHNKKWLWSCEDQMGIDEYIESYIDHV